MPITIKRARRVVDLVTDLSLYEQYTEALRVLEVARADKPLIAMEVGENPAVAEALQRVSDIEAEMAASVVHVTLEASPRQDWTRHCAEHPPREGHETDAQVGVDISSLDAVIQAAIRRVNDADGNPVEFAPADWPAISADMSDGQWAEFAEAIIAVNRGSAAPKSKAGSLATRLTAPSSSQPEASE